MTLDRRRFLMASLLAVPALGTAALPAAAHTPFRQWKVFRQRYLLITTSRTDLPGDALGDRFAAILADELPESRAMVSRAIDLNRVASLISTDQANIAILEHGTAAALARGDVPFRDYGPCALRGIVRNQTHSLVCREDVPAHHAYLIAATLMGHGDRLGIRVAEDGDVPAHPGAAAYARGEAVEPPQ
jgi:hypothetical protein